MIIIIGILIVWAILEFMFYRITDVNELVPFKVYGPISFAKCILMIISAIFYHIYRKLK